MARAPVFRLWRAGVVLLRNSFRRVLAVVGGGVRGPFPRQVHNGRIYFWAWGRFLILGIISPIRKHAVLINLHRIRPGEYFISKIGEMYGGYIRIFTAPRNIAIHLLIKSVLTSVPFLSPTAGLWPVLGVVDFR